MKDPSNAAVEENGLISDKDKFACFNAVWYHVAYTR